MKNVLAVLAVLVIVLNAYVGYSELSGTGSSLFNKAKEDEGGVVDLKEVIVPAVKLHDDVLYDYKLIAEMYWKNINESDENFGQWEDYRLDIDGTSRHSYRTTTDAIDGYSNTHKVLTHEQKTIAGFNILVRSSDGDDLSIPGNMDLGNTEYMDLTEKINIQNDISASVDITRLPKINQPVSFNGYLRDWADPKVAPEKTFEEEIAGDLKPLTLEDKGTVVRETFFEQWNYLLRTEYNWTVEGAEMISGYPSMRINITTNLFGEASMPFNETLWMSNEVPLPTKKFTRTYTNWSDDESEGFMLLETTFTIRLKKDGGYTSGDKEVPWGQCGGTHWDVQHVAGEYKSWDKVPQAGAGYVDSSFLFTPDDAADFAEKNSVPLQKWMSRYKKDRMFIEWADYNATPKVPGEKPGSYEWQLYYSYYPTMDEIERAHEADQMNFSFSIHVIKNITKSGIIGDEYNETVEIDYYNDSMRSYGAALDPRDLSSNMLTLASSEDILLSLPEVRDNVTSTLSRGRIDWSKSIVYDWGTPALGGESPGMQMVTTLTGMEFPTTKTAWTLQKGTVWEEGDTYMATVDAETGRLVMVTHIEGTALFGLFGG